MKNKAIRENRSSTFTALRRRALAIGAIGLALGIALAIAFVNTPGDTFAQKELNMSSLANAAAAAVPPIDLRQPAQFETATFGMG